MFERRKAELAIALEGARRRDTIRKLLTLGLWNNKSEIRRLETELDRAGEYSERAERLSESISGKARAIKDLKPASVAVSSDTSADFASRIIGRGKVGREAGVPRQLG